MSKSLGNFFTLRDLLAKGFTGREVRYLLLTAHYRETFNFTIDGLQAARTALTRIDTFLAFLLELKGKNVSAPDSELLKEFSEAMDDDLNVSRAWGIVFEWIRKTNRLISEGKLSEQVAAKYHATWAELDKVFGIGTVQRLFPGGNDQAILQELLASREAARKAKDFKRSDAIRDELKLKGWTIEDTPKGARLKKL